MLELLETDLGRSPPSNEAARPPKDTVRALIRELLPAPPTAESVVRLRAALVPSWERHALGAFDTPAWLADIVLDEVGYHGSPAVSLLDPACGTGVFLVRALRRLRARLEEEGASARDVVAAALASVHGVDLDPMAVQASRLAYRLALQGLGPVDEAAVPVTCADAVVGPPAVGRFDRVVGNPPWVTWRSLDPAYRRCVRREMEHYGLMATGRSSVERLGQAGKDLSMLFVTASVDRYLAPGARLGFIVTQSVLQSTAGAELRRFRLPDGSGFGVVKVIDLVDVPVFADAAARPAVLVVDEGAVTTYPVVYEVWSGRGRLSGDATADEARTSFERRVSQASPATSSVDGPWLIGETPSPTRCSYRPRKGIQTGAEGVFRLILGPTSADGTICVTNDVRRSKRSVPVRRGSVEATLLFPYTSGRSLQRWRAGVTGHYLVPHTAQSGMHPLPEEAMARKGPGALAFLESFRDLLDSRAIHRRWGTRHPFWSVYNIGPYTFAPYKVAWRRVGRRCAAAVISTADHPALGRKLLLPNESLMIVPFDDPDEAWFVAGVLNSTLARRRIEASVALQLHSEILDIAGVPTWNPSDERHAAIAEAARRCGAAASSDRELSASEASLDVACALLA